MIEAAVTLKKGGALVIVSENWSDLVKILEAYEITGINARVIGAAEIRQGKERRSRECK